MEMISINSISFILHNLCVVLRGADAEDSAKECAYANDGRGDFRSVWKTPNLAESCVQSADSRQNDYG